MLAGGPGQRARGAGARSERRWRVGLGSERGERARGVRRTRAERRLAWRGPLAGAGCVARLPARWGQGVGGAGGCARGARAGLVERERGVLGRALPFWAGKREGVGEPGPCWPWGLLGPRERKGGRAGLLVLGWGSWVWVGF